MWGFTIQRKLFRLRMVSCAGVASWVRYLHWQSVCCLFLVVMDRAVCRVLRSIMYFKYIGKLQHYYEFLVIKIEPHFQIISVDSIHRENGRIFLEINQSLPDFLLNKKSVLA